MSGRREWRTAIGCAVAGVGLATSLTACGGDATEPASAEPVATATVTETVEASEPPPSVAPVVEEPTYTVVDVVDGDTLDLDSGDTVRLAGIDTPERGECGFGPAQSALKRLVLGKEVTLVASDEDHDKYGRLLRYVEVAGLDAGLRLIRKGLAIARYDSRDGYGRHPREDAYVAADEAAPDITCPKPKPEPEPDPEPRGFADTGGKGSGGGDCEPGYDPCVPSYPPDLDCADTGPVTVTGPDPHGLDRDGDGVACGGD
ncbi:MAG TPA: thermonuclease family protein [Nocardioides sp.]|nr:thermonuclease family protein [Nocardioides sp.]